MNRKKTPDVAVNGCLFKEKEWAAEQAWDEYGDDDIMSSGDENRKWKSEQCLRLSINVSALLGCCYNKKGGGGGRQQKSALRRTRGYL